MIKIYNNKILRNTFILLLIIGMKIYSQNILNKNFSSQTVKILPLGNSITFDERSNDTRYIGEKAGYRRWLYNLLKNAGFNFDFVGSEHAGGNYLPAGYDDNGGFPGISDNELFDLLQTGHLIQKAQGIDKQVTAGPYLNTFNPDIILLHIGTNGNDEPGGTSSADVEKILDQIDIYERESGRPVTVLLARIINRVPNQSYVNTFNNNVVSIALDRVNNPLNDAYPDKIIIVDMQDSTGIDYNIDYMGKVGDGILGDMSDNLHPNDKGYKKMADMWFKTISSILPNPPLIIQQPKDQFTVEGISAIFDIHVKSNEQVNYQWKKNGTNISLAKDSVLYLSNIQLADNNALISCAVTNMNGTVISQSARLYVNNKLERISKGKLVEYDFEERDGTIIHNKLNDNGDLDLNINSSSSVEWISNGISINNPTNISTLQPALGINDSINNYNQFSIELWFSSSEQTQSNTATILTVASNSNERNFNFGQNLNGFNLSTRTTETNLEGIPDFSFQTQLNINSLTHLIFTRSENGVEKVYINGVISDSTDVIDGNLSNWDSSYKLAIANNFLQNQPWLGNIYYVAIYKRELNNIEIKHNFDLGETGISDVNDNSNNLPSEFVLNQNYPNPFNPTTTIKYSISLKVKSETSNVKLIVYDVLGREVTTLVNEAQTAGNYEVNFNGNGLSSGIYFYQIKAGNFVQTKKMILVK
jgi:lysophospholipase L1-like esterase